MALDVEDTMGRGEDRVPSSLGNNRRSVPCPSLRRCHTTLDQDSSLIAVGALSQSSWLVAGIVPRILRQPAKKLKPDQMALLGLLPRWQGKAAKAERRISRLAAHGFGLPIGPLQRTPIEACEESIVCKV